jgi:hypothetical protein
MELPLESLKVRGRGGLLVMMPGFIRVKKVNIFMRAIESIYWRAAGNPP